MESGLRFGCKSTGKRSILQSPIGNVEDLCALGTLLIAKDLKGKGIAIAGRNSYEWAVSFLAAISSALCSLDTGFGSSA